MSTSDNFKVFWDAVHGQIKISSLYCKHILDTAHFQRLKRLEQTNTRPLYPCAHHDRFIHSLGTYHLGRLTFKSIRKNSEDFIKKYAKKKSMGNPIEWDTLEKEFYLACLLHDVGHAPFSHTFEEYFNVDIFNNRVSLLDDLLKNDSGLPIKDYPTNKFKSSSESFIADFDKVINYTNIDYKGKSYKLGLNPKEHEKVSAYLVLSTFQNTIRKTFSSNPFHIARMILGVKFSEAYQPDSIKHQIYNCFIELLNGEEIDVDKIDYLMRDQWATGNYFRHIDCSRLLSSIYIEENEDSGLLVNFFHKKSINEIIAIKEARHNLATNIHSHPIVKYDDYLLKKAVNDVIRIELQNNHFKNNPENIKLEEERKANYISRIVSVDALLAPVDFCDSMIFLPTDDDLVHYLKKNYNKSEFAQEWLSRDYKLKSLWKSPFDFNFHFSVLKPIERKILYKDIERITRKFLTQYDRLNYTNGNDSFYIQKKALQEYKVFRFESNLDVLLNKSDHSTKKLIDLINIGAQGSTERLSEKDSSMKGADTFFYLYLRTPYTNKIFNQKMQEDRKSFYDFAIQEVKAYSENLLKDIDIILRDNPDLIPEEIAKRLPLYEEYKSEPDRQEMVETVLLLLMHLLNEEKVFCKDTIVHPRKRKFSLKNF